MKIDDDVLTADIFDVDDLLLEFEDLDDDDVTEEILEFFVRVFAGREGVEDGVLILEEFLLFFTDDDDAMDALGRNEGSVRDARGMKKLS